MTTIRYDGWIIKVFSYSEETGDRFVAECWGKRRLAPNFSVTEADRNKAIACAKAWCDKNIPF